MKANDLLLNTDESKVILKKMMTTHATPKNIAEYAMAIADQASLKTTHTILDELWNIWDTPDQLHRKIREIEKAVKEIEDGNITKESK